MLLFCLMFIFSVSCALISLSLRARVRVFELDWFRVLNTSTMMCPTAPYVPLSWCHQLQYISVGSMMVNPKPLNPNLAHIRPFAEDLVRIVEDEPSMNCNKE